MSLLLLVNAVKFSNLVKVHMTRKISHSKNTLIEKAFRNRVKWHFSFCDIFFYFRDLQVLLSRKFSQ